MKRRAFRLLRKMFSLKRSDLSIIFRGIPHWNISGVIRINSLNLCNFNDFVVENANNRVNCMLGYFWFFFSLNEIIEFAKIAPENKLATLRG